MTRDYPHPFTPHEDREETNSIASGGLEIPCMQPRKFCTRHSSIPEPTTKVEKGTAQNGGRHANTVILDLNPSATLIFSDANGHIPPMLRVLLQ